MLQSRPRPTVWRRIAPVLLLIMTGCGTAPVVSLSGLTPAPAAIRAASVPGRFVVQFRGTSAASQFLNRTQAKVYRNLAELGVQVVEMPAGTEIESVQAASEVSYAEPDYLYNFQPAAQTQSSRSRQSGAEASYSLQVVDAADAWQRTKGSSTITIAVVDTGIDPNHPDLKGKITGGYNVLDPGSAPTDENGHGTHVAGIAAGNPDTSMGISGIAPSCRIMPIKVANAQGVAATSDIAEGIAYAALHGASVINLSIGGPTASKTLEKAVAAAVARHVPIVAAMGNDGSSRPMYPAAYAGVIAVGATDAQDEVTAYSQTGKWISVVAPGDDILSTTPTYVTNLIETGETTGRFGYLSGTSMATPMVTGIVALMRSLDDSLSPDDLKQKLESSTDGSGRFSTSAGYGRVNAAKAVGAL